MTRTWTQSTRHAELLNIHTQIGKAAVRRHLFNHKLTSARRQHLQPWALHIVHDEFNFTNLRRTCISAACPVWLPNSTLVECQTVVGKYKELNSKANSDIFLDRERYALKPVKAQACMLATTNALGNFDHITSCANMTLIFRLTGSPLRTPAESGIYSVRELFSWIREHIWRTNAHGQANASAACCTRISISYMS
jgi:hypothetical protein